MEHEAMVGRAAGDLQAFGVTGDDGGTVAVRQGARPTRARSAGTVDYVLSDHLGSTSVLLDTSGNVVASQD